VANLDSIKFGTLGKLLCAIGSRSHGYDLHNRTGLSLRYVYEVLPVLIKSGLLREADYDNPEGRRYVALTEKGKMIADIYYNIFNRPPCRIPFLAVLFDLDGVIFERPWNESSDTMVAVSTWNLLFRRLGAYNEHERLKNKFKRGGFKSYNEWTNEACRVLQRKGLTKQIFYEVINSRRYNAGVKDTLKTLIANGVTVGVVTGSFYELAERVKEEFGLDIRIDAHCMLEFDEEGLLKGQHIIPTDYEDKATFLNYIKDTIPSNSIAYVGDDVNDLGVFKKVGLSIAFNAVKEKVKKSAKVVVEGNDLRNILPYLMVEPTASTFSPSETGRHKNDSKKVTIKT
jgi:phosphoserine phosphatase